MKPTDTIIFTAVLSLTITAQEADRVLNGPDPTKDVHDWIELKYGIKKCNSSSYEVDQLKTAYSKELLFHRLEEAKQLEYKV